MSKKKKPKPGQFVKIKYHHSIISGGEKLNPYLILNVEEFSQGYETKMTGRGKNRKEVTIASPHARKEIWLTCVTGSDKIIRFTENQVIELIEEIDF